MAQASGGDGNQVMGSSADPTHNGTFYPYATKSNELGIRPIFYLDRDFFTKERIDLDNIGRNIREILISDYDVSRAMVTINFDDLGMTVSINGNMCNSGDIYYYTLGTTLNFVATVNDEFSGGLLYVDWIINGENLTESNEVTSTFSLLVNNNMTYNVAVGLTVTSHPHPNPNPNPDLWG